MLYRFRKFTRKHRAAFTTAALLAASLLIGTTVSLWQAIRATAAEAQAVANEAKAQEATAAEANERKQAEANLQVALEAVDRMLVNVMSAELNDVPRVGPLRRELLKDALSFFERISPQPTASPDARVRAARTWSRIAHYARRLDDREQILSLRNKAIAIMTQLVAEHPKENTYRYFLAEEYRSLGGDSRDLHATERAHRRSCELLAELANDEPGAFAVSHAGGLLRFSKTLRALGKDNEANGCVSRAWDIAPPDESIHWEAAYYVAKYTRKGDADRADEQFRTAIAGYRQAVAKLNETKREPGIGPTTNEHVMFAAALQDMALEFETRHPDEAEALRDEAIAVMKAVIGPSPALRGQLARLIGHLADQGRFLRKRTANQSNDDPDKIAQRLKKADDLFLAAISQERLSVSRFLIPDDRFTLAKLLHEQAQFLLKDTVGQAVQQPGDQTTRKTQADALLTDALLTEALQLCRALAAEFPANADYKSRLAALLKLHAQHFGQKPEVKP